MARSGLKKYFLPQWCRLFHQQGAGNRAGHVQHPRGRHRWEGTSRDLTLQWDQEKNGNKSGADCVHPSILKACEAAGWGSAHPLSCCRALIPFFHTKIPAGEPALEGGMAVTVTPQQLYLEPGKNHHGLGGRGCRDTVLLLPAQQIQGRERPPLPTSLQSQSFPMVD